MSDGITLYCPSCGELSCLKKEYDELKIRLKELSLKHQEDENWYNSSIPVYTCSDCKKSFAIEKVNK